MIMAVEHDLEELAAAQGVSIRSHRGGEKARWHPGSRVISLREGLGPINRVCSLAHELGHAALGHYAGDDIPEWLYSRQEKEAEEWAAKLLISTADYARAEQLYGSHPGILARELGVTVRLVEAWRRCHERTTI